MKNPYIVMKKPLFTEKGSHLKETENKILIEVSMHAKALEEIFKVKVEKVSTIRTRGKWKKFGRSIGKRPDRKKAIITLKKGEKLDFVEGV